MKIAVTSTFLPVKRRINFTHKDVDYVLALGSKNIYAKNITTKDIYRCDITTELFLFYKSCEETQEVSDCYRLYNNIRELHIRNIIKERGIKNE